MQTEWGFSLLEVMVALLLLSVGILGLASLQLTGVQHSRDTYYRTQAILLSNSIAERMRVNLAAVNHQHYAGISGVEHSACRTTGGCTAAQLAADDVYRWRDRVAQRLPAGGATVCIDSQPETSDCDGVGHRYAAKIWWDHDRDPNTEQQRLSLVFSP